MDMELADLTIDGKPRKVVMTAPKNGFFYVIDRTNGKLISAEKIAKVTWATRIDLTTGRPVEVPGARFPNGQDFEMWPSDTGAHSWMPMAFSPQTRLVYIPKIEQRRSVYNDRGFDLKNWKPAPGIVGQTFGHRRADPLHNTSALLAWNPVTQKQAWKVDTVGGWNGGVLATAGNLVFQGQLDGRFSAYAADSGKELWHFPAQAAILAAPISYRVGGKQYVTVLVGMGTSASIDARTHGGIAIEQPHAEEAGADLRPRRQGEAAAGTAALRRSSRSPTRATAPIPRSRRKARRCSWPIASAATAGTPIAGGGAPDLRASPVPQIGRSLSQRSSAAAR